MGHTSRLCICRVSLAHLINTNITKINFIRNKSLKHDSSLVRINTPHENEDEKKNNEYGWLFCGRARTRSPVSKQESLLVRFADAGLLSFHFESSWFSSECVCDKINLRIFYINFFHSLELCQTMSCNVRDADCLALVLYSSIQFCFAAHSA